MAQWEYSQIITLKQSKLQPSSVQTRNGPVPVRDFLDEVGMDGWELVSTDVIGPDTLGEFAFSLWLKREVGRW